MNDRRKIERIAAWRLYVITDESISKGRSHEEVARLAVAGGADVIQLRDKTASDRRLFEAALRIRETTSNAGAVFIIDDRLDIALAANVDGLHIGLDDLPIRIARQLLGAGKILGVSARSVDEAVLAEREGADYLGVGPVFEARGSKPDAGEPTGLDLLREVRSRCIIPVVAIGGIDRSNAAAVIDAGADCAAVVSAVAGADDITAATAELTGIIQVAKSRRGQR